MLCVGVAVNRVVPFVPSRRTQSVSHEPLRRQGSSTTSRPPQPLSAQAIKHIWVRTALFEKVLDKIVQYIVDNSRWLYSSLPGVTIVTHSVPLQALLLLNANGHQNKLFSVAFSVSSLAALFCDLSDHKPQQVSTSCPHLMVDGYFTDQSLNEVVWWLSQWEIHLKAITVCSEWCHTFALTDNSAEELYIVCRWLLWLESPQDDLSRQKHNVFVSTEI